MTQHSIFTRLPESYTEHPDLPTWVKADPCGPIGRAMEIIQAGTVLDVGAGSGILGRMFMDTPQVTIDGLDPATPADHPGVTRYRRFDHCRLEDILEQPRIKAYDWFVFADVIEHMSYPDVNLSALARAAAPHARILISTPNIAHMSVRLGLLDGDFTYTPSGILESTHLRFFTLRTLQEVLAAAGLKIDRLLGLNRPHYPDVLERMPLARALAGAYAISRDPLANTYQFMAVCSIGTGAPAALEPVGDYTVSAAVKHMLRRRYGARWFARFLPA